MKNRIVALSVAVLGLVSVDAFASVARQAVMGQADPLGLLDQFHGSFYYDDNYNIFYNPSYANDFKNWAAIEKDNAAGFGFNNTSTADGAEGGFVAGMGSLSLGAFFNRESGIDSNLFGAAGGAGVTGNDMRPIDLIIAGDMGVKWGLGVMLASAKGAGDDNTIGQTNVYAGAQIAGFEPFAEVIVNGSDEVTPATGEDEVSGFQIGTRYKMGEWIPYAVFQNGTVTQGGVETDGSAFGLGLGRNMKLTETVNFNYALAFFRNTQNNRNVIPLDISVEAELTTWLAGRAGFLYNVWDRVGNVSQADTVSARLGASFMWDKVSLDWAVGGGTPGYGNIDSQAFDFSNGLFSFASLNYKW